jgi:hypothetical protein
MCLTVIAGIDAAGGKLPIWMFCRGKTVRCEALFRTHVRLAEAVRRGEIIFSHEENDWTRVYNACGYLRWLWARFGAHRLVFLWDIFSTHRCSEARALAAALNINLEFISPV